MSFTTSPMRIGNKNLFIKLHIPGVNVKRLSIFIFTFFLIFLFNNGCEKIKEITPGFGTDTLDYNLVNLQERYQECTDEDPDCTSIEISYPVFTAGAPDSVIAPINRFIMESILFYTYGDESPSGPEELMKNFMTNYEEFLKENNDYKIGWTEIIKIKVVNNNSSIVSLEFFNFNFMGGAHPSTTIAYENFNSQTGRTVMLSDIFMDGFEPALEKIAEEEFRKVREIPNGATYESQGFWFDNEEFILTNNFALQDNGILFFYNSYEIAPYAMGQTKLFLSWDKLEDIINP